MRFYNGIKLKFVKSCQKQTNKRETKAFHGIRLKGDRNIKAQNFSTKLEQLPTLEKGDVCTEL